ncbi:hypothetical protein GOV10_01135, partial [Candidatus Woesearchaeota archaeon]|nr:hypothetical protein [Candidatus Woesearchaeota archaeon]
CKFDDSDCQEPYVVVCGDGILDTASGEQCEKTVIDSSCTDFDAFTGGGLSCTECTIDTSTCTAPAGTCNDGILDPGEECDGSAIGTSCTNLGYVGGKIGCTNLCTLDLSLCTGLTIGVCTDGIINNNEVCDGTNISASCVDMGFAGGKTSCTEACHIDTSECQAKTVCGDGKIQPGEQCDGSTWGAVKDCSDILPTLSGTPRCDSATCLFDLTNCAGGTGPSTCGHNCAADTWCEKACALDSNCMPDPDCGDPDPDGCTEKCTANGICNDLCELTSGCSPDPDCGGGGGDDCPYTCSLDDECVESCADNIDCMPDPDCEKGFDWLALVFIILGFLIIGGSSYYLYIAYEQRQEAQAAAAAQAAANMRSSQAGRPVGASLSPQERAKMLAALKKRREAELEAFKKHAAARTDKRHKALEGFDDDKPSPTKTTKEKPPSSPAGVGEHKTESFDEVKSSQKAKEQTGNKKTQKTETKETDGATSDDYISLDDIGKEPKKKPKQEKSSSSTKSEKKTKVKPIEDDSFDALDDFIDETKS